MEAWSKQSLKDIILKDMIYHRFSASQAQYLSSCSREWARAQPQAPTSQRQLQQTRSNCERWLRFLFPSLLPPLPIDASHRPRRAQTATPRGVQGLGLRQ